ncbi:MAG: ATP-binding protein, partial [Candidatus Cloacimonadota bacterium]|nr:ATP-binding protein [Candidatus Cloacimonadota bacterium]
NDLNKATKDLKSENAERKQTEILLRESEENLRTLFNAMTDVVFEMNYEGRYINIAPTSPELLYKLPENTIGKTLHEIFPKPEADNFLKFIQKSLDENKTTTIEYPLRIRDKIIWFEGKATPKTKNSVLFIARDITKSKKAQAELKAYREHLEDLVTERTKELKEIQKKMIRQERLAVLGQLAGGVGHELRNPLGVIGNSIYFLNMKLKHPEEKVEKHLGILRREIARADNLISDLLDFSRVREVSLRKTDLNKLIKNAIQEIKIPKHVVLEMDLDEKLPKIQLDSERMRRVFQNLISNAFQSISKKGELKIKTGSSNGFTEIRFMDNGIGIPPENLTKIFEPLFTTRAKGIGLGLSIVKNIIDNHKGEIDVESKVGLGTTFTIKLAL